MAIPPSVAVTKFDFVVAGAKSNLAELQKAQKDFFDAQKAGLKQHGAHMDEVTGKVRNNSQLVGELGKKWGEANKQFSNGAGVAGKAVDFIGGKVKAFGSSLVSGAMAGLFAGVVGGSISSIIQKLFAPPTPEEQRALATALTNYEDQLASLAGVADFAAKALKRMGEAETADMMRDKRKQDFDTVQAIREQYDPDTRHNRMIQEIKLLDQANLDAESYGRAIFDIGEKYKRLAGITEKTAESVKSVNRAAKETKQIVDGELLDWFKTQTDYSDTKGSDKRFFEDFREQQRVAEETKAAFNEMVNSRGSVDIRYQSDKSFTGPESMFGPLDQYNEYRQAFLGLSGAIGSMYEAIVTGSDGALASFKKFISGSMLAEGKWALGQAGLMVAAAFKALANPLTAWQAPAYFLTAGKYTLAAAALGAGAALVGGGGGGGGSGGSGGGSSSGGGAAPYTPTTQQQQAPTHNIIFVNDPLGSFDSGRAMQSKLGKVLSIAGIPRGPNDPRNG